MSKVFRHVITGLVSILLDAIILKSRLLAQGRGGSAREKGRGEEGRRGLRAPFAPLPSAAPSLPVWSRPRRRLWKRPLQSARAHGYWAAAAATACPASCRYRTPQPGQHCALTLAEKAGANRPPPALGPRSLEGRAEAGKKEARGSAA